MCEKVNSAEDLERQLLAGQRLLPAMCAFSAPLSLLLYINRHRTTGERSSLTSKPCSRAARQERHLGLEREGICMTRPRHSLWLPVVGRVSKTCYGTWLAGCSWRQLWEALQCGLPGHIEELAS
jgi:hypothetical protein